MLMEFRDRDWKDGPGCSHLLCKVDSGKRVLDFDKGQLTVGYLYDVVKTENCHRQGVSSKGLFIRGGSGRETPCAKSLSDMGAP